MKLDAQFPIATIPIPSFLRDQVGAGEMFSDVFSSQQSGNTAAKYTVSNSGVIILKDESAPGQDGASKEASHDSDKDIKIFSVPGIPNALVVSLPQALLKTQESSLRAMQHMIATLQTYFNQTLSQSKEMTFKLKGNIPLEVVFNRESPVLKITVKSNPEWTSLLKDHKDELVARLGKANMNRDFDINFDVLVAEESQKSFNGGDQSHSQNQNQSQNNQEEEDVLPV